MIAQAGEELIRRKINGLSKKSFIVFVFKNEDYRPYSLFLLDYMTKKLKMRGIYIQLSKYDKMNDISNENIAKSKDLHFILSEKNKPSGKSNTSIIKHPGSLVEISDLLTSELVKNKYDFVIFGSLSELLVENGPPAIERFLNYAVNNLLYKETMGIGIIEDGEASSILNPQIRHICTDFLKL